MTPLVIIILTGLVIVHEAGHLITAILLKIRVDGLSIGFGPALFKRRRYGINFALRLIPLGGFVSFPDKSSKSIGSASDPDLLSNRSVFQRTLVTISGVMANLIFAWIILIAQGMFIGLPTLHNPGVLITSVQTGKAGYLAGLRSGDLIVNISGYSLKEGQEGVNEFVQYIKNAPGENIEVTRQFSGKNEEIHSTLDQVILKPDNIEGLGQIGVQLQANLNNSSRPAKNSREIFDFANVNMFQMVSQNISSYSQLLSHFNSTASQVSGPIKIVETGSFIIKEQGISVFVFTALVSINLAVLNSLPLPFLDGGQLLLLFLESLRGRPLPKRIENIFIQIGIVGLLGFILILFIHDTLQLNIIRVLFE